MTKVTILIEGNPTASTHAAILKAVDDMADKLGIDVACNTRDAAAGNSTWQTLSALRANDDYKKHYNEFDQGIAESQKHSCGRTYFYDGLKSSNSYRAFVVCHHCKYAEEF